MKIQNGLMSLLYSYIKRNKVVSRNELRGYGLSHSFDTGSIDRKLRLLTQHGYIKPTVGSKGFNSSYKLVEDKKQLILNL